MRSENQGLGIWEYDTGVGGVIVTGDNCETFLDPHVRALGMDGTLEHRLWNDHPIRVRTDGNWETVPTAGGDEQDAAIDDLITALTEDRQPALTTGQALAATEIVFNIWESAHPGGRFELPLSIEGNPLEELVAARCDGA